MHRPDAVIHKGVHSLATVVQQLQPALEEEMNSQLRAIAAALQEALANETRPRIGPQALDVGQRAALEQAQSDGSRLRLKPCSADALTGLPDDRGAAPQFQLTSYRTFVYGATRLVAALPHKQ